MDKSILARFPGPVTLYVATWKKLLGLAFFLAMAVFVAWLLFGDDPQNPGAISGPYETIMAWLSLAVGIGFAIRWAIVLLVPRTASLTLDAEGFKVSHIFHSIRRPWRGVSEFRIELLDTRRLVGPIHQVGYDDLTAGARRPRALPRGYGWPEDIAPTMNEWRERALAQAAPPS